MTKDTRIPASRNGYLFIIPWEMNAIGGVNQVVNNLSIQFRDKNNVEPLILVSKYGHDEIHEEKLASGIPLIRLTLRTPESSSKPIRNLLSFLKHFPGTLFRFRRLLTNKHISTINIHFPNFAALTVVAAVKCLPPRKRLIISFHGADINEIHCSTAIWKFGWRVMLGGADSIVLCSTALANEFAQIFPKLRKSIKVVHNGVDYESLLELANTGSLPEILKDRSFILNAATFEHKKGQDVLINAFASLADRFPDVILAFMGRRAEAASSLNAQVQKLNLQHRVFFFENVDHADVLATMKEAKAFVMPSRLEPFGIAMLEAAVFDTPVIASRTGGIVEVIENERSGILVEPEDVNGLADALARVLEGGYEIDAMAGNLKNRAVNMFTWKRAASHYLELAA